MNEKSPLLSSLTRDSSASQATILTGNGSSNNHSSATAIFQQLRHQHSQSHSYGNGNVSANSSVNYVQSCQPQATIDTSAERLIPSSLAAIEAAGAILQDRAERRESQQSLMMPSTESGYTVVTGLSSLPSLRPQLGHSRMNSIAESENPATVPSLETVNISRDFAPKAYGDLCDESYQDSIDDSDYRYVPVDEEGESEASSKTKDDNSIWDAATKIAAYLPAIATASVLNFMIGIPFGASYFPVEWSNGGHPLGDPASDHTIHDGEAEFPLPGKEALGLRMFLFSTMMAQLVFTFKSKFNNGIGLQMVENVPFCLELARIVTQEQGFGAEALSTLFFLFGFSSLVVGAVFYLLGKLALGRVVYFFPSHVLVGCIGGIGAFIVTTSIEVSTNTTFHFTLDGMNDCIVKHFHLLSPVLGFEIVLRLLLRATAKDGISNFPLLAPVYYCLITPVFYFFLWCVDMDWAAAQRAGYFFPPIGPAGSVYDRSLFDIFTVIHFGNISWRAVVKSFPTMISLTAFSLIHVPINIPAFAISSNVEPDMNAELIAHGFSNALSGVFGGLQNYMAYSNSVIYSKSQGKGKLSSLAVVAVTILIFLYGPNMASFVPRCMAGTLLLHVGIDLFLEGVYQSYHDYDILEYCGIWLITVVMVAFGMDAALIAGIIAALSTYAVQSITYQYPIRGAMTAARLRSSAWNRSAETQSILMNRRTGRHRIYVIQLQGHIFFGNVASMTDGIKYSLREKHDACDEPIVVILDFSHVLGLDSSAAQAIAKLKDSIRKNFEVELVIFVTGKEEGFPCSYDLTHKVMGGARSSASKRLLEPDDDYENESFLSGFPPKLNTHVTPVVVEFGDSVRNRQGRRQVRQSSLSALAFYEASKSSAMITEIPNSHVCQTLDDALIFAEDVLIAIQDPDLLQEDINECSRLSSRSRSAESVFQIVEENGAKLFLEALCIGASKDDIDLLFTLFVREKYLFDEIIWEQGLTSDSLKLLVCGSLISLLEDENGATETIHPGSTIGELGLVNGTERLTTVKVRSGEAILYSLHREKWESLTRDNPRVARYIDMIVVRYLAHRVQHVSNHILDRRSLPV